MSLCSTMINPGHQISQGIGRGLHSHFESGNAGSRHLRNLFVRQLFDVLEEERFALIFRQHAECPLYVPANIAIGSFVRAWCNRSFNLRARRQKPLLSTLPPCRESPALIHNYLVQPTAETLAIAAAPQVAEGSHEGRLKHVVGIHTRSKHSDSE